MEALGNAEDHVACLYDGGLVRELASDTGCRLLQLSIDVYRNMLV